MQFKNFIIYMWFVACSSKVYISSETINWLSHGFSESCPGQPGDVFYELN